MVMLWLIALGARAGAALSDPVIVSHTALRAGGATVAADVFAPKTGGNGRSIVVLHGAGGTLFDGPEMRRVARALAASGYAVYVVHYFDRTGTIFARDRTMQENFHVWLETVIDSIAAVQAIRGDASPVGIYGYSLGAFLALQAASDNPRVGAVVEQAGGVWNSETKRIGKMPPVLMLHGERDGRVPFDQYAKPLQQILRVRSTALQTRFFDEEGHVFTPAAMTRARAEAVEFFSAHLPARAD